MRKDDILQLNNINIKSSDNNTISVTDESSINLTKESAEHSSSGSTKINLTINETKLQAGPDDTILTAARANGIDIPTLCYVNYSAIELPEHRICAAFAA